MSEARALELIKGAEKAQQKSWFSSPKYDEAGDLYEQASTQFKLVKKPREAGDTMMKAAEMSEKSSSGGQLDAAQRMITASKSYKKVDAQLAVDALTRAVAIFAANGRLHSAAAQEKEIAKLYEEELSSPERAMESYRRAAEWYADEESHATANSCKLKVATFAAQLERYSEAIELFEKIGEESLNNQLSKWSVKDYFLKAGLCWLAIPDDVGARSALERYLDWDPGFRNTRECKFLDDIINDVSQGDIQAFTDHIADYDQISQLDNWKTTLLLRIKGQISEAEEDLM